MSVWRRFVAEINQSINFLFEHSALFPALPILTSMLMVPPGLSSVRLMCFLLCWRAFAMRISGEENL